MAKQNHPKSNEHHKIRVFLHILSFCVQAVAQLTAVNHFGKIIPDVYALIMLGLSESMLLLVHMGAMVHDAHPFMTKREYKCLLLVGHICMACFAFIHIPAVMLTMATNNVSEGYVFAVISAFISHGVWWKHTPAEFVDTNSKDTTHAD